MIQETDIITFIPQRYPMIMLSSLIFADQQEVITRFNIKEDNIFVKDACLMAPGIVENIAQSVAARAGYLASLQNTEAPAGFIGAVQNLEILELPKVGDVIETTVTLEHEIFHATIVTGTVRLNEKIIAHCKMKIFVSS